MAEASTLTDALTILQDAQKALIEAKAALTAHNDDEDAHQAIQDRIKKLENDDNIYSNDEIEELIEKGMEEHEAKDFRVAHANWDTWYEGYQSTITSIYTRLTNLEKKDTSEEKTDLDATLAAIEEKYASQLESLQKAFKAAQDQGQTELADMYKENIQKTLDAKSKEIMEAIEAWQKEHGDSTDGDSGSTDPDTDTEPGPDTSGGDKTDGSDTDGSDTGTGDKSESTDPDSTTPETDGTETSK